MKLHIVTIGKPKLAYARLGWEEYLGRLQRLHTVRLTQLADKYAYDVTKISEVVQGTFVVVLEINGTQMNSENLAEFLVKRALDAREVSFIIGGPEGLPETVRAQADYHGRDT
jgi:23S rRNA (pseudouridine1915-N3)-methyltransferase